MGNDEQLKVSALAWLYEMEAINSPVLQANLQENILLISPKIKNCEVLIMKEVSSIMVYIEVNWINNYFYGEKIKSEVTQVIKRLLPSFRSRVVTDRKILNLTIKKLVEFYGVPNEPTKTNDTQSANSKSLEGSNVYGADSGRSDPKADSPEQS